MSNPHQNARGGMKLGSTQVTAISDENLKQTKETLYTFQCYLAQTTSTNVLYKDLGQ